MIIFYGLTILFLSLTNSLVDLYIDWQALIEVEFRARLTAADAQIELDLRHEIINYKG